MNESCRVLAICILVVGLLLACGPSPSSRVDTQGAANPRTRKASDSRSQFRELDCGYQSDLVVNIQNDYFGDAQKAAAKSPEIALTTYLESDASLERLSIENFTRDHEDMDKVTFVYKTEDRVTATAMTERLGKGWIIPHLRVCQSVLVSQ